MKMSEARELNDKDLRERLQTLKSTLNQLKINHAVSPLENPKQLTMLRKDVARLKTETRQREQTNIKK
jgi:large subunit ribosomal protein L29